jgi:transcriptional regulator GlxA family with amidase domain
MKHVTILVMDGCYSSTLAIALDCFHTASTLVEAQGREPLTVVMAQVGSLPISSHAGLTLQVDATIDAVPATDLIVIPAFGPDYESAPERFRPVLPWLVRQHAMGASIATGCSGVILVAASGLLDGREATTHPDQMTWFRKRYPDVCWRDSQLITDVDNIYCAAGAFSMIDLCIYLLCRKLGQQVAQQCADKLMIERPRLWHGSFTTPPRLVEHDDLQVQRAEEYLCRYFATAVCFESLARELGMSPRNFTRRFKRATGMTPMTYLHALRIDVARRLLVNDSHCTVQDASHAVGYDDVGYFRRLFRRCTGQSPSECRSGDMKKPGEAGF